MAPWVKVLSEQAQGPRFESPRNLDKSQVVLVATPVSIPKYLPEASWPPRVTLSVSSGPAKQSLPQ